MNFGIDFSVDDLVNQIVDAIKKVFNDAVSPIVNSYNDLRNYLTSMITSLKNKINNIIDQINITYSNITNTIQSVYNDIIDFFKRLYDNILTQIYTFGDTITAWWIKIEQWIANAINESWKFISSTWEKGKQTIITLIALIAAGFVYLQIKRFNIQ
jgi:ABC-type proline/glycine betaine transport system permease subunit